jgi:hypothetical protein
MRALLGGGLVLLILAGVGLLAAYFLEQPAPVPTRWVDPVASVRSTAVAPDLAVLPLAGEDEDRVVRASLAANEVETAYAGLAYSLLLPDDLRGGHWVLLAQRYAPPGGQDVARGQESGDQERALICYQAVLDEAALSPELNDTTRAGLALQAARGMAGLGKLATSRLALTEAEEIARYSLTLLPAQRRDILVQVIAGFQGLGDQQRAGALETSIDSASAGPGISVPPPGDVLATLRGSVVLPADVTAAIVARQAAAAALAAGWLQASPTARAQLATALGSALSDEDAVRARFYGREPSLSPADQLAMLHDQVAWLTIKYRVARLAYGTSLVAAWEGNAPQIASQLSAAYSNLIDSYSRRLDTLAAGDAEVGRLQLLQQALLWVRLGLLPAPVEATLSAQLSSASQQLWTRRGSAGLVIITQDADGQHFYLLSGSNAAPSEAQPTAEK